MIFGSQISLYSIWHCVAEDWDSEEEGTEESGSDEEVEAKKADGNNSDGHSSSTEAPLLRDLEDAQK